MPNIQALEARRVEILSQLAALEPFHRGTVYENYRKCGKPSCRCANPDDPGHGPRRLLTWKVGSRSKAIHLHSEEVSQLARRHVDTYQRFQELTQELIEIAEQLSEACFVAGADSEAKKKLRKSSLKKRGRSQHS